MPILLSRFPAGGYRGAEQEQAAQFPRGGQEHIRLRYRGKISVLGILNILFRIQIRLRLFEFQIRPQLF